MDSGQGRNPYAKVFTNICAIVQLNKFVSVLAIECPSLSPPANGQVVVSGLRPGDEADYSCNPGFHLRGAESRTCQVNGEWSNEAPSCICKLSTHSLKEYSSLVSTHAAILCEELTDPANGEVTVSGRTPGSVASYTCRPGFALEGATLRTCQSTGRWSLDAPVCVGKSRKTPTLSLSL